MNRDSRPTSLLPGGRGTLQRICMSAQMLGNPEATVWACHTPAHAKGLSLALGSWHL